MDTLRPNKQPEVQTSIEQAVSSRSAQITCGAIV
jgi:hypothetical protein